jgi:lipopolysaccharide transport system ATP-binding protein
VANSDAPLIELRHVGVHYAGQARGREGFWALRDVSFTLKRGETLGIIGRNGAGKTTMMRLLAGILQPDRGELLRQTDNVQLLSLQVGFISQLTGRENAIMSGILLGMRRRQVEAAMDEIIAFSELQEFIDEPVLTYSAGMRARLGFAIAHQASPDVLLIDEVLGVGDAGFREKTRDVIVNKIRSGETVVIVSHQEATLREHCHRVVWIDDGRTRMEGTPAEVLPAYAQDIKIRSALGASRHSGG